MFPMMNAPFRLKNILATCSVLFATCVTVFNQALPAYALEEVKLSFAGFQFGRLVVQDLADFATTGEASQDIEALLEAIDLDRATAISLLNNPTIVDRSLLEAASYTFVGESFLQLVGTAIKLPNTNQQSWPYLREALITSATDNQVSMIEMLQEFRGESITVDVERVGQVIEQIQKDSSVMQEFLTDL